jgi:DNA-binding response OmpR family regulator
MLAQPSDEQYAQILVLEEYEQHVQPAEYSLETGVCTVGRAPACAIVVRRNLVSRIHAKIERSGAHYILSDAGSTNGTFVNYRKIHQAHLLKSDDLIGLGSPEPLLRFYDPDATSRAMQRLHYDAQAMVFVLGQTPINLTQNEFRLLLHLYQHAGEVCTHESCAQAIWGREYQPGLDGGALEQTISKTRGKLRQADPAADLIETRRGIGYMLVL